MNIKNIQFKQSMENLHFYEIEFTNHKKGLRQFEVYNFTEAIYLQAQEHYLSDKMKLCEHQKDLI